MVNLVMIGFVYLVPVIVLTVVLVRMFLKETEDDDSDKTLVTNFMSQYTGGYAHGVIVDFIKGKHRNGYKIYPRARDLKIVKKEKIEVKPRIVWVEKCQEVSFPKPTLEKERNVLWILPPNAEDFPENLKDVAFGQALVRMLIKRKAIQEEVELIREDATRKKYLLKKIGGGEATREEIQRIETLGIEVIRGLLKGEDKTKHKGFSRGDYGSPSHG